MNIGISAQFARLNGIKVEEIFGNCLIYIEPGTFCIFDKNTPSNGMHYHNCYEMCLVTGGSGEFVHAGESYILQEGDVFIANPGIIHEIRLLKGKNSVFADHLHLVFFRINIYSNAGMSPELYEEKMLKKFLRSHTILCRSQKHLFSYLSFIESYCSLCLDTNYGLYQIAKNMTIEGMFSLVNTRESHYRKQVPVETIVDHALDYIGANLHRRIFISEIAANACTSERNLQHLFQKHIKKSIIDYINGRKTAIAAGYLKMNFKMSDICNLIGVYDASQFSRLFKKYYGLPPKKYQMNYSPGGMVSGASFKNERGS